MNIMNRVKVTYFSDKMNVIRIKIFYSEKKLDEFCTSHVGKIISIEPIK